MRACTVPVPLGRVTAVVALGAQPIAQCGQRVVLAVRDVLQKLCDVGDVRHGALAALLGEHASAHARELRGLEDRSGPARTQLIGPIP